jgi:hypothetical protein
MFVYFFSGSGGCLIVGHCDEFSQEKKVEKTHSEGKFYKTFLRHLRLVQIT